jgi:DNA-binding transcriptional LysR family regulator
MTLEDLRVFATVAAARSFSKAARTLNRTQSAVSQAVRRLEAALGETLIDRSSRDGTLTDAGTVLLDYTSRLLRLAHEAGKAVADLRDVRTGRVLIGANEGAVHAVLPLVEAFLPRHPGVLVEIRRVHARQMAREVLERAVDFGVLTFDPQERDLASLAIGTDELVLLVAPNHPIARRRQVTMEEMGRLRVIAHNDPSPAREHVLRLYERRRTPLNICLSLPSLDGIKRAVETGLGVALLPRRCAQGELARGQLLQIHVPELRSPRPLRLVYRRAADLSHAAAAFLDVARDLVETGDTAGGPSPVPARQKPVRYGRRRVARSTSS